jgi:hypothetical protein
MVFLVHNSAAQIFFPVRTQLVCARQAVVLRIFDSNRVSGAQEQFWATALRSKG